MNRIIKALVFIPIIALSSCSFLGKEVNEDFANKYEEKITDMDDIETITFKLDFSGTKGGSKSQSKGKYILKKDKDDNKYFYVDGNDEGEREFIELYQVNNETYEEVTWVKYLEDGKEKTACYAKKDNADYNKQTSDFTMTAALAPSLIYALCSSPSSVVKDLLDSDDAESIITYYSTGEKNLSVKKVIKPASKDGSSSESTSSSEEDDDEPNSGTAVITYNNYLLSSINVSASSDKGTKQKITGSASYGKVTVSLPSGWEKLLAK